MRLEGEQAMGDGTLAAKGAGEGGYLALKPVSLGDGRMLSSATGRGRYVNVPRLRPLRRDDSRRRHFRPTQGRTGRG